MRERAVRLVSGIEQEAGNVMAACRRIGEELGINSDTLRGWVKQAQIGSGKRPGITSGNAARIRQLERENAELRRVRPRFLRLLYVPCSEEDLYIAFTAPRDDAEGSQVPIHLGVWSESFPHLTPLFEVAATLPGRYDVYETTVVRPWTQGRVALVGDAAHAMTPSLAQGANSAMVNALALAENVDTERAVEDVLPRWEEQVRPATDATRRTRPI